MGTWYTPFPVTKADTGSNALMVGRGPVSFVHTE